MREFLALGRKRARHRFDKMSDRSCSAETKEETNDMCVDTEKEAEEDQYESDAIRSNEAETETLHFEKWMLSADGS